MIKPHLYTKPLYLNSILYINWELYLLQEREREELSEYIVDVAADNSYGGDEQEAKFHDEIQRLRSQVNTIANRYQETGIYLSMCIQC